MAFSSIADNFVPAGRIIKILYITISDLICLLPSLLHFLNSKNIFKIVWLPPNKIPSRSCLWYLIAAIWENIFGFMIIFHLLLIIDKNNFFNLVESIPQSPVLSQLCWLLCCFLLSLVSWVCTGAWSHLKCHMTMLSWIPFNENAWILLSKSSWPLCAYEWLFFKQNVITRAAVAR